jgi:hypothetical protein
MGKIKNLKLSLAEVRLEKLQHVKNHDFEKACAARDREKDLLDQIEAARKNKTKKFLTKVKRSEIEEIILGSQFSINTPENRSLLGASLSKALGFSMEDITTNELVDDGFVCFRGYDPISKKVISITIAPTTI